jgi:hypothetical protein
MIIENCFKNKNIEFVSLVLKNKYLLDNFIKDVEGSFVEIDNEFLIETIAHTFTILNFEKINYFNIDSFLYSLVDKYVTVDNYHIITEKTFFWEICLSLGLKNAVEKFLEKTHQENVSAVKILAISDFNLILSGQVIDSTILLIALSNKLKLMHLLKQETNISININYIKTKLLINFMNSHYKFDSNLTINDEFVLGLMKQLFTTQVVNKNYELLNLLNNRKLKESLDYYVLISESFHSYSLINKEGFEFREDNYLAKEFCSYLDFGTAMDKVLHICDSKTKKMFIKIFKRDKTYYLQTIPAMLFIKKIYLNNYGAIQSILNKSENLLLFYSFNSTLPAFSKLTDFLSKLSLHKKKLLIEQLLSIQISKKNFLINLSSIFEFIPSHRYEEIANSINSSDPWSSIDSAAIQICEEMKHENFNLEQEKNYPNLKLLDKKIWEVAQSKHQLLQWGRQLQHCIGTQLYAEYAKAGKNIILGYKELNKLKYTLEIKDKKIVQIQGKSNLKPSEAEFVLIKNQLLTLDIID